MRIAIVHYHLQPGGVTRIIEHAVNALADQPIVLAVLTGEETPLKISVETRVVPRLAYEERRPTGTPSQLANDLMIAARDALGGMPDVWHIHNHALGKNLLLPEALAWMVDNEQKFLFQLHDFVEDGRPFLYQRLINQLGEKNRSRLSALLYPVAPQIHYAVLNQRDFNFFKKAGCIHECLHLIPNPVELEVDHLPAVDTVNTKDPLWLYPTRAIRRKNLGEFLLWATVCEPGSRFATTLGPENPQEQLHYRRWQQLAAELKLPIDFEVGRDSHMSFFDLLHSAHAVVTTSIAEGFGMAYLEPWLAGQPIYGRDLSEITQGFRKDGIILDGLYERLNIPLHWIGRVALVKKVKNAIRQRDQAYGKSLEPDALEQFMNHWVSNEQIDFGCLEEDMQIKVIRRLHSSQEARAELVPARLAAPGISNEVISGNQSVLEEKYGLASYGSKLMNIYRQILSSGSQSKESLDTDALLNCFLAPERLSLLRID
ncbi:MAG: hypothetical protein HOK67_07410 [Deltaproteobacteria bacterium]|nr:hypothetical protein [Deltaproteobacteria bacterium]MBT6499715.1 hypothetical protein [Deltaproteobacteria bacterium]MBT6611279.1 hypothetical protein [Deltaproteobacteria bacterium]MBT7713155.1 hypothetical protein [Deltaproteobacteria bacterium]